jgi:hypothetical protein
MEARTAVHEAGHASCAYLLGAVHGAGPLTIVPGKAYHGIAFVGHPRRYQSPDLAGQLDLPYVLLPARLRRYWESKLMVLLAGEISEELHPGEEREPVRAAAVETLDVSRVALPPSQAAALDEAAALDSIDSDFITAMKVLRALHQDNDVKAHRARKFWATETMTLMDGKRARRMVEVLSAELLVHKTLPAARWKAILAAVQ